MYEALGVLVAATTCLAVAVIPLGHRSPIYLRSAARWHSLGVRLLVGAFIGIYTVAFFPRSAYAHDPASGYQTGFDVLMLAMAAGVVLILASSRYARSKLGRTIKPSSVRWTGSAASVLTWFITFSYLATHVREPASTASTEIGTQPSGPMADYLLKIFGWPAAIATAVLVPFLVWAWYLRQLDRYGDISTDQYPGQPEDHAAMRI